MDSFFKKPAVIWSGAGLFFLVGTLICIFWNYLDTFNLSILGFEFFHSGYETLGRFGFTAVFFIMGGIVLYQGYAARRQDKNKQ